MSWKLEQRRQRHPVSVAGLPAAAGRGWQIDPGILHAPGSLVTYEPQVNSDVFAMFQSMVEGRLDRMGAAVKDVPKEYHHDLDYLIGMLDWEANVNPEFGTHKGVPETVHDLAEMKASGYRELWVTYGTGYYSAKELTVLPGRTVTITDRAAYGLILTQGHGNVGRHEVETPTMIRFGEMTEDEFFVTAAAANQGVSVKNRSESESAGNAQTFRSRQSGRRTTAPARLTEDKIQSCKPRSAEIPGPPQRDVAGAGRQRARTRSRPSIWTRCSI